jgi:hypothetical protein
MAMKRAVMLAMLLMSLVLFGTASGDTATEALPKHVQAEWSYVETITIDGYTNSLPEGETVGRTYEAGTYKFVLSNESMGISYNVPSDYPYTKGCFIMVLEDSHEPRSGTYHSMALSEPDHKKSAKVTFRYNQSQAQFFIMDWYRGDNDGWVQVKVYKLK